MKDTRSVRARAIEAHIDRLEKLSKVQRELKPYSGVIDLSEEELREYFDHYPQAQPVKPSNQ
jgi:hypothetical protein